MPRIPVIASLAAVPWIALAAIAQEAPPADEPAPPAEVAPGERTSDEADAQDEKAPPSLDELLGIDDGAESDEERAAAEVAKREIEEELQRRLTGEEIKNAFAIAIDKMGISAERLDEEFDPGLGTQRVQEEVLAKLMQLIDEAKQQQQQQAGGSSSSGSQQQQQQQQSPGKQRNDQQQQDQGRRQDASDSQEGEAPPPEQGDPNSVFEESRTEWGGLPERVREMLLQGRKEKFSGLYEQLTREYYRRLAEEGTTP